MFFDAARVVTHPNLSLAGGAIRGWDSNSTFYWTMIQALAKHYKFDMTKPWKKLPEKVRNIVLYGNDGEKIQFKYENKKKGNKWAWKHAFEGIIPNMQRRYTETAERRRARGAREVPEHAGVRDVQRHALERGGAQRIRAGAAAARDRGLERHERARVLQPLSLAGWRGEIADKIVKEIANRLKFLADVGLGYLSLDRSADTLSGGEAQRIRLASQIGSGLVGVMYILDEPSIGLHQRDNQRLLDTLMNLRDLGNTVLVVEHDSEAIMAADYVVDLGPGAGVHGGQIVAQGTPKEILANAASLTGQYLSGKREIPLPSERRDFDPQLVLRHRRRARQQLEGRRRADPRGPHDVRDGRVGLRQEHARERHDLPDRGASTSTARTEDPAPYDKVKGLEHFDYVIDISQAPIGRTPRSNPATYSGVLDADPRAVRASARSRARAATSPAASAST